MGIEYQLRFAPPAEGELDGAIRALPFFRDYNEQFRLYHLWLDPQDGSVGMPDGFAAIKSDGLYYCNNRGSGEVRIRESLLALARRFDPAVILEEL